MTSDSPENQQENNNWSLQYLEQYGMEASLGVPASLAGVVDVHSNMNFGRIEFSAGKAVDFFITEANETVESRKFDLESGIFKIEYIQERDGLLFYKATLPDGSSPYFHFFSVSEGNGVIVQFESNPLIEFSENDIVQMLEIIDTFKFN